jgi:hypothetical protein
MYLYIGVGVCVIVHYWPPFYVALYLLFYAGLYRPFYVALYLPFYVALYLPFYVGLYRPFYVALYRPFSRTEQLAEPELLFVDISDMLRAGNTISCSFGIHLRDQPFKK